MSHTPPQSPATPAPAAPVQAASGGDPVAANGGPAPSFICLGRSADDVGLPQLLAALAGRACSSLGQQRAQALPFLPSAEAMTAAMARIDEARALARAGSPLPMVGFADIGATLTRIDKEAQVDGAQLLRVAQVMGVIGSLRRFGRGEGGRAPALATQLAALPDVAAPQATLEGALHRDGAVRDDASAELWAARAQVQALSARIRSQMEAYLNDPTFSGYLQDSYVSVRHGRYVLPINASFQAKVDGIVHNASHTGLTLFIEPAAVTDLGNRLSIAKSREAEEVLRVLRMLAQEVAPHGAALAAALGQLAELDVVAAASQLADELDLTSPGLVDPAADLHLPALRHPLLLLTGRPVVANSASLHRPEQVLLLSGPNAGGKTVTLTALGLAVLMARVGLPIAAAPGARLPAYAGLFCAVSDAQSIEGGLSAFAAQLTGLHEVVRAVGPGWLVLVDELGGDTDPTEGAALARSILDHVAGAGAQACATTHLEALKAVALVDPRYVNARVGYDAVALTPTYRLERGVAGRSWALDVAARMGFPPPILAAARAHLGDAGQLALALRRLEDNEIAVAQERQALAAERAALAGALAGQQRAAQEAAQAAQAAQQAQQTAMAQVLHQGHAQVTALMAQLRAEQSLHAAQRAAADLAGQAAKLARPATAAATAEPVAVHVAPGAIVHVPHLRQNGRVVAADADYAWVLLGGLRTRVPRTSLAKAAPVDGAAPGATQTSRAPGRRLAAAASSNAHPPPSRCDVRGLRLDEAERRLIAALDACLSGGSGALLLVHGHGTGALRDGMRDILRGSPYVSTYRAGEAHEGGDGVTYVALDV